jgi:thiamine biosynthesis lipoprotein
MLTRERWDTEHGPGAGVERRTFRSMGMDIAVAGPQTSRGPERLAFSRAVAKVERLFLEIDARCSRFRPDSELSRVNAAAGRWQRVSAPFAELLRRALDAARATDGLFDPTILPALVAAGYDRDFDEVVRRPPPPAPAVRPAARWRDVRLDGRLLFLPRGAALDFGGIAKGWAVDRALEQATALPWAMVDAGGDLAVRGTPPEPLSIGVADPFDRRRRIALLGVDGGALATSSTIGRSWGAGRHHVIDPRTWRPSSTPVVQATVWAPTCTEAEILSTWALLLGPRALREADGILVMDDGAIHTSMPGVAIGAQC